MYPRRAHRHTRSFGPYYEAETLRIPMYSQTAQSIARQTRRHHKKPAFGQTSRGNLNLHPPENHSRQIFNLRFSCLLPQCSAYTYLFPLYYRYHIPKPMELSTVFFHYPLLSIGFLSLPLLFPSAPQSLHPAITKTAFPQAADGTKTAGPAAGPAGSPAGPTPRLIPTRTAPYTASWHNCPSCR